MWPPSPPLRVLIELQENTLFPCKYTGFAFVIYKFTNGLIGKNYSSCYNPNFWRVVSKGSAQKRVTVLITYHFPWAARKRRGLERSQKEKMKTQQRKLGCRLSETEQLHRALTSTEQEAPSSRSRKLNLLPGTPAFYLCYKLVKILVAQFIKLQDKEDIYLSHSGNYRAFRIC